MNDTEQETHTYLNYGGNCEQAFRFYEQHLGGQITMLMRHGENPAPAGVGPDWKDAVLHARMQETFFAARFAMLRDRFGTSWMLLHPKAQSASAA